MLRLFERTKEPTVEFCDRCGSVCTAGCRRDAIVAQARDRAIAAYGWRLS